MASLFDQMFPGAQKPNNQQAQYSAPYYRQVHTPGAPGYEDPSSVYAGDRDTLRHTAERSQYYDDQAYGIQRMKDALGLGGPSGGAGGGGGFVGGGVQGSLGGDSVGRMVDYAPSAQAHIPGVDAPDMTNANAAIFGRAKDQTGQTARASLQSLRDELGATGMLGSGAEAQGSRDIISRGLGQLGEVSRESAVNEAGQKADFAKMKYQGDITQRGQDIAAQEAAARLALQRELAQQDLLKAALAGLSGMGGGGSTASTSKSTASSGGGRSGGIWMGRY